MFRFFSCWLGMCLALSYFMGWAANEHEYAEIKKAELEVQDFNLKTVGAKDVHLTQFVSGKKLVLLWYFAPWCENSRYDTGFVLKLYEKYKDKGFDVLGISNYASLDELKKYLAQHNIKFTVVYETTEKNDNNRLSSQHFKFRDSLGDKRNWGTPFSVFILNGQLDTVYVAAGELIPEKAEQFVAETLRP